MSIKKDRNKSTDKKTGKDSDGGRSGVRENYPQRRSGQSQ